MKICLYICSKLTLSYMKNRYLLCTQMIWHHISLQHIFKYRWDIITRPSHEHHHVSNHRQVFFVVFWFSKKFLTNNKETFIQHNLVQTWDIITVTSLEGHDVSNHRHIRCFFKRFLQEQQRNLTRLQLRTFVVEMWSMDSNPMDGQWRHHDLTRWTL